MAQPTDTLTVKIHYSQGQSIYEPDLAANRDYLSRLGALKRSARTAAVKSVKITSGASPEGDTRFNQRLSEDRTLTARSLLAEYSGIDTTIITSRSIGIDWEGLKSRLSGSEAPCAEEAIDIVTTTPEWIIDGGKVVDSRKRQLRSLCGGLSWQSMERDIFPKLRVSEIIIIYEKPQRLSVADTKEFAQEMSAPLPARPLDISDFYNVAPYSSVKSLSPCHRPIMALRSNLLYDAALVPNIGVEFNLGRGFTAGADFYYAWWSKSDMSRIWRWQGGEIFARKYFGRRAAVMQGWFAGLYGQMLRYDVLLGSKGYLSGGSRTSFFNHPTIGAGLQGGYTLGLNSSLALDFTLGVGYLTGRYQTYSHSEGLNVWKSTLTRRYFGPTKAEISLVWYLWKGGRK